MPLKETSPETKIQKQDIYVGNLDCDHDAATLERGMAGTTGLVGLKVYPKSAKVSLSYDSDIIQQEKLETKLAAIGFPPQKGRALPQQPKLWENPKIITSVISGLLLGAGWLLSLSQLPSIISVITLASSVVIGGYYFGREAYERLRYEHRIGVEMLMSVAAITAALLGQPVEAAILVFLYSISEAAEGYTEEKTRSSVRSLIDLTPKTATVIVDGEETVIPVEEIADGDLFVVYPGQSIPTDGIIVTGTTAVNQAPITGESLPVEKLPGDNVLAASLNGEGAIEVRATKSFADNSLSRIIHLVEEAQERKSKSQRLIERFGDRYSPAVLIIGILIAIVPPLLFGADWGTWLTRATVFIVAAAPCALVISIPVTMVATLGTGARQGVLIKGSKYVEELSKIRAIAIDKTGTITEGKPQVTEVKVLRNENMSIEKIIALAAGIEKRSEHPLAKAIVYHAAENEIMPAKVTDLHYLTGTGAKGTWENGRVTIGNPSLFEEQIDLLPRTFHDEIKKSESTGQTVVVVGDADSIWGLISLRDRIRPTSISAIESLYERDITHIVMLTGDNEQTGRAIAQESGIKEYHAQLRPEDKAAEVRKMLEKHQHIAMVGDGINDAPALAESSVGVAMGAAGTDVALETADVALMGDDLERLVYALDLSRRNQSIVRQNLFLSILIISALSLGAVFGLLSLPMAVVGHEISEILVIGNGMRMLRA